MLHPVFQEDELTLILVGAVLGLIVGFAQLTWDKRDRVRAAIEACAAGDEEACEVILVEDGEAEGGARPLDTRLALFLSNYAPFRWVARQVARLWAAAEDALASVWPRKRA